MKPKGLQKRDGCWWLTAAGEADDGPYATSREATESYVRQIKAEKAAQRAEAEGAVAAEAPGDAKGEENGGEG